MIKEIKKFELQDINIKLVVFVYKETKDLVNTRADKNAQLLRSEAIALTHSLRINSSNNEENYYQNVFKNSFTEMEKNFRMLRLKGFIDDERLIKILIKIDEFRNMQIN